MTDRPMFDPASVDTTPRNSPKVVGAEPSFTFNAANEHAKIEAEHKAEAKRIADVRSRPLGPLAKTSFSALMQYESCPYASYLKRVEGKPDPSGPAAERGSMLHESIENYIQHYDDELSKDVKHFREMIEGMRDRYPDGQVIVEQDWGFTRGWETTGWVADDVWQRTKLDVIEFETKQSAWIVDWKSGRKFGNEMKHGQQLQLYAIASFLRYPELEFVKGEMIYIDKGERLTQTYTKDEALRFFDRWDVRFNEMTTATTFPAKPSKYNCKWCPHRKAQEGFEEPACDYRVEF